MASNTYHGPPAGRITRSELSHSQDIASLSPPPPPPLRSTHTRGRNAAAPLFNRGGASGTPPPRRIKKSAAGGGKKKRQHSGMGRAPCCEKDNVKRGQWTPEEDSKLAAYIAQHGTRNWRLIPKNAGLQRCGKSCRLRWTNYLRPDLKHGDFSEAEEHTIVKLHSVLGNRWSLIAAQLPGRTDNDVKNHWNTKLKKKLSGMGIDPVTHKPFSHLIAEITTLVPPQMTHLAEAALGCFKDEVLHMLTRKRAADPSAAAPELPAFCGASLLAATATDALACAAASSYFDDVERSAWGEGLCAASLAAGPQCGGAPVVKGERGAEEEVGGGSPGGGAGEGDAEVFGADFITWDLSDDLMDSIV